MKILADCLSSIITLSIMYFFFHEVLRPRAIHLFMKVLIGFSTLAILILIALLLNDALAPLFTFLVIAVFTQLSYQGKILSKFMWVCILYILTMMLEILSGLFFSFLTGLDIQILQGIPIYYILADIASKILSLCMLKLIGFFKGIRRVEMDRRSLIALIAFPISSIATLYYISVLNYHLGRGMISANFLILLVLIFIPNLLIYYLIERQSALQKAEQELIHLERLHELQTGYYVTLKESMIATNARTHDIKNILLGISSFLAEGETELALQKINDYLGAIPEPKTMDTGSLAINALMQSKMRVIESEIPNHHMQVQLPRNLYVDEIDLCILIGNAIDNAIAACQKISNPQERYLRVDIIAYNNQISMRFENSCVYVNEEKKPFSSKQSSEVLHGYGIKNMQRLCEQYGGYFSREKSNSEYCVNMLLPNLPS